MSGSSTDGSTKWDVKSLKDSKYGYERYMTAKYYKNLTESQYISTDKPKSFETGFRRESLNPAINLARLRDRIATTEAISNRYTVAQKDWLRLSLEKMGSKVWKFKFNYLIKLIVVYKAYSEYCIYKQLTQNSLLSSTHPNAINAQPAQFREILKWSGASLLTMMLI